MAAACSNDSGVTSGSTDATTTSIASTVAPDTSVAPSSTAAAEPSTWDTTIEWASFGVDTEIETGTMQVPIDYTDPSKGTITLSLSRHLADTESRIGSLLVNPGGPGFSGTDLAIYADQIYSPAIVRSFDVVAWDPRGTGLSEPAIDCTDDYDHFFTGTDITPDTPDERQQIVDLAAEFSDECVANNTELLPYVGTNSSARDMDSIRRALGEATISYFGFSYGSELGATWATLFPDTVRAAVLDGASDPNADFLDSGLQQAAGFEQAVNTFLDWCSGNSTCEFGSDGDAAVAFDDLMAALDEQPVPSIGGRPDVTRGMALTSVAYAMYDTSLWKRLGRALDNARYGDGELLLELFDAYYQRRDNGTYDNSLEAFQVITCMDDPERLTVAEEDASAADYQRVAPRYAPGTTGSYFCTFFPPSIDPRVDIAPTTAVPILVIGTTGDPATPLTGTRAMADSLSDGRLVIVDADQHTGYGVNQCSINVVDEYLLDPTGGAPDDEYDCGA